MCKIVRALRKLFVLDILEAIVDLIPANFTKRIGFNVHNFVNQTIKNTGVYGRRCRYDAILVEQRQHVLDEDS